MFLYDFVYRDIVTKIYSGFYKKGEHLPALPQLCEEYQIGRNTARTVIFMLEENGYIKSDSRKTPLIIFDFNNPAIKDKYLDELAQRKDAIHDIYETIAYIMPRIAVYCLSTCDKQERMRLAKRVETCIDRSITNDQELYHKIFALYQDVIKLANNNLLIQLFDEMFRMSGIPMSSFGTSKARFQLSLPVVKTYMKSLSWFVQEANEIGIIKELELFCKFSMRSIDGYLERICKGRKVQEAVNFHWIANQNLEHLYVLLTTDILNKRCNGMYKENDFLPSYATLAKQYNVSLKTVRNAVATLNQLHIVKTINGLGTILLPLTRAEISLFLQDEHMRSYIITSMEALHLLILITNAMIHYIFHQYDKKQLVKLANKIDSDMYFFDERLLDILLEGVPQGSFLTIIQQLRKNISWGRYLGYFMDISTNKNYHDIEAIKTALKKNEPSKAASIFYRNYLSIYQKLNYFLKSKQVPLSIAPIKDKVK